jgi:hypothetical protein
MNTWGILFLALSWGLIITLVVFSFVKVLGKDVDKSNNK